MDWQAIKAARNKRDGAIRHMHDLVVAEFKPGANVRWMHGRHEQRGTVEAVSDSWWMPGIRVRVCNKDTGKTLWVSLHAIEAAMA